LADSDGAGAAVVATAEVSRVDDEVKVGPATGVVEELAAVVVLEAAGVVEAGAEEAGVVDPATGGRLMGTPACWQVDTTAAWTFCWSATEQALFTQGVMVEIREGFEQWHLKSVRLAQPSDVRAVVKQVRAQFGISGSDWALVATAAARARRAYVNCILTER